MRTIWMISSLVIGVLVISILALVATGQNDSVNKTLEDTKDDFDSLYDSFRSENDESSTDESSYMIPELDPEEMSV